MKWCMSLLRLCRLLHSLAFLLQLLFPVVVVIIFFVADHAVALSHTPHYSLDRHAASTQQQHHLRTKPTTPIARFKDGNGGPKASPPPSSLLGNGVVEGVGVDATLSAAPKSLMSRYKNGLISPLGTLYTESTPSSSDSSAFSISSVNASLYFSSSSATIVTLLMHFKLHPNTVTNNKHHQLMLDKFMGTANNSSSTSTSYVGLSMPSESGQTWRYMRVFAEPTTSTSSTSSPSSILTKTVKRSIKKYFFSSGSVVSRWVKVGSVFQMNLALKADQSYNIFLLKAFEDCPFPLEVLSASDFKSKRYRVDMLGTLDKLSQWPNGSTTFNKDSILASFPVKIPPFANSQEGPKHNLEISSTTRDDKTRSVCSENGAWVDGNWIKDTNCFSKVSGSSKSLSNNNNDDYTAGIRGKSICILGDSHVKRMFDDYGLEIILQRSGVGKISYMFNAVEEADINFVIRKEYGWQTATSSMFNSMSHCVMNSGRTDNGVVIWWYGSHSLFLSEKEVARSVYSMAKALQPSISDSNMCILVVGILDLQYENIVIKNAMTWSKMGGKNYSKVIPYYQNSFRVMASNNAIQRSVNKFSNVMNIHYVDLFPQSLALHFDGHDDAVHYSEDVGFYSYAINEMLRSVSQRCNSKR